MADVGQDIEGSGAAIVARPWYPPFLAGLLTASISLAASWVAMVVVGLHGLASYAFIVCGALISWGIGSALSRMRGLDDLDHWPHWPLSLGTVLPLFGFIGFTYMRVEWFGWHESVSMESVFYPALAFSIAMRPAVKLRRAGGNAN